jgi:hypothetical protein
MSSDLFSKHEIEQIIVLERLHLYNLGCPCGPLTIQHQLLLQNVHPLPSLSTIKRTLNRHGLTHRRTGLYP